MDFFQSNIHLNEVFVQLVSFVVIFWVLKKFAWQRILKALDDRRERIKNELELVEAAKKNVEQLRAEYTVHLQKIDEEARQKLEQAASEGKQMSREIQEEARQHAREILEKAKEDIQLEVAKAKVSLRDEIAGLTISATEHLLEKKIDEKQDKDMILEFINKWEKHETD